MGSSRASRHVFAFDSHGARQPREEVASAHLNIDFLDERRRRADGDLDFLCRALADGDVVVGLGVLDDGRVERIARDADGRRVDDAAHADHGDLGRTATDVDDHGAGRAVDGQAGANGRRPWAPR